MTREQTQRPAQARKPHADLGPHPDGGAAATVEDDADPAWTAIQEFAEHGKGKAADLPRLLKQVPRKHRDDAHMAMPAIAARMSGEQFLACAKAFGYVSYFAIQVARDTAKPPATDAEVRGYLRGLELKQLVELEAHEQVLQDVQQLLPGPLGLELPQLAEVPAEIHGKPKWIEWFLRSTKNQTVAAVALASAASAELAATLDGVPHGWDWLDAIKAIGGGSRFGGRLKTLRGATKDKVAGPKLDAMVGALPDEDDDGAKQKQREEAARAQLDARIAGEVGTDELLDMTARAGYAAHLPEKEMLGKLAGQPADVVLQFAVASPMRIKRTMPLLLDAPDATASHVMTLFYSTSMVDERLDILKDDRLRPRVRKAVGRDRPFLDFFPDGGSQSTAHAKIVDDEALRTWIYEGHDPRTMLWLAAGSPEGAKAGCGHVRRERGFKWVERLPVDAEPWYLRRFALTCNDAKAKQQIERLLADTPIEFEAGEWDPQAIDPVTFGKADQARFAVATRVGDESEEVILERIAELEPDERAAVVKDPSDLKRTLKKLPSSEAALRAVYLLDPTIAQLVGTDVGYLPRAISYLRTRPAAEEAAVLADEKLTAAARRMFGTSPFVAFPSLLDPKAAAKAIEKNGGLLDWIFDDADASQALAVLSREPAKAAATARIEGSFDLYDKLPKYRFLLPEGKAGFDAIEKGLEDDEAREDAGKYKAGKKKLDAGEKEIGKALHDAAAADHLWTAIEQLGKDGDAANALAVVRTFPKDQVALLSGGHTEAVETLRAMTFLAPQHVFPNLGVAQLLSCPDGARWLFELEAPFAILGLVAGNAAAIKQLARLIEASTPAVAGWLDALPRGGNLDPPERQVLDELCRHLSGAAALRRVFEIRFDVKIEEDFDGATAKRLWGVLARLPPAQVNQRVIQSFRRDPTPGAAGLWDDPNVVLSDDDKDNRPGDMDTSYEDAPELTADQIKKYYGLDDAAFAKAIDPARGWIEVVGTKYKVKPIREDQFRSTVLHEVGHSVDTLLGERTELVFGLAGWKNYGVDQVEEWASDMGALDGVKGADRAKIIEAWRHAFRIGATVDALVPADHPAVAKKYAHVPLVKAARESSKFDHAERREVNGKVGLTGNNQGTIATIPKSTADVAPSRYALSAPAEFFAECYVEYYREYQGTKQTEDKKGGKLAVWIKDWFHANVDRIELNPGRLVKGGGGEAPSPAKKQG